MDSEQEDDARIRSSLYSFLYSIGYKIKHSVIPSVIVEFVSFIRRMHLQRKWVSCIVARTREFKDSPLIKAIIVNRFFKTSFVHPRFHKNHNNHTTPISLRDVAVNTNTHCSEIVKLVLIGSLRRLKTFFFF